MSARSSSFSQLVERPKASSLPRLRMSTGRQGFELEAQQLHLEGPRPGARGGGVDAGAEALELGAAVRVELRHLALGGTADPQRSHQPVDRQALRPGHLGDPAADHAAVEVHLPEPVLAVAEALGEPEVGAARRPRRGARPSGRGAPGPGLRERRGRCIPFCFGRGAAASQCQAAAVAAAAIPVPAAPATSPVRAARRAAHLAAYWLISQLSAPCFRCAFAVYEA